MPRPKNTEDRRRQIVAGLLAVMAKQGFEKASVAEIARAAHLTTGLIHYHFHNKQEILLVLIERLAANFRERVQHRRDQASAAPRDQLFAIGDALLAVGDDRNPAAVACWVAIGGEALRQPEVAALYGKTVSEIAREFEHAVRGVLESEQRSLDHAQAIAAAAVACAEGYFRLAATQVDLVPAGSAAESLRAMLSGLLDAQAKRE